MVLRVINKDKYSLSMVIISPVAAVLIHSPESVSLFDRFEGHLLFSGIKFMDVTNEILFTFVSLFILSATDTCLSHFNQTSIKITAAKILLSFTLIWVPSNLLGQVSVLLRRTFDIPAIDAIVHHYLHPSRDFIVAYLVTSSCYIIYPVRRQWLVLIGNGQLQAENIRNQYEALRSRLNPHMLFSSLSMLRSLVRENQDKARDYIQELSRTLRYTLQSDESQSVSLREETGFTSAYIFPLKMRFENSLQFDIQIAKSFEDYCLPPMVVQVLIENAVKHDEISDRKPLTTHIVTNNEGYLSVSNDIQSKRTAVSDTGIGLVDLAKRHRLLSKQGIQITEGKELSACAPFIDEVQRTTSQVLRKQLLLKMKKLLYAI